MSRISYINGRYVPHAEAVTHIEDRGYQLADGVYEYIAFYNRTLLDGDAHLARLWRSLGEMRMNPPMAQAALKLVIRELIYRNAFDDGGLYLQVTRGIAKRDHAFPKTAVTPVLSMTVCAAKTPKEKEIKEGAKVITQPDIRWGRCDIKSIGLLANCFAKQAAVEAGARESWLIRDGVITEGCACNAYIVTDKDVLVTHPEGPRILPGITRTHVLRLAREAGFGVEERPFTREEALNAREAFLTSTSPNVLAVTLIDGKPVGSGKPGEVTTRLRGLYNEHIRAQTGKVLI